MNNKPIDVQQPNHYNFPVEKHLCCIISKHWDEKYHSTAEQERARRPLLRGGEGNGRDLVLVQV